MVLVAAGEPPAASDVVWVREKMEEGKPGSSLTFTIYTVPKGRGFLLREVDGDGCRVDVYRGSLGKRVLVQEFIGFDGVWKSTVGIPFSAGDTVELKVPPRGQSVRISGVLTAP